MPKVFLDVPYSEKDVAKQLGAKWSPELKRWYIPEGVDAVAFEKWLPPIIKPSLYALPKFYLVMASVECYKCGEVAKVYCVASDKYEMIEKDDDSEDESNVFTAYSSLKNIPAELESIIQLQCVTYFKDFSRTTKGNYYINHCASCRAKIGDHFLHDEPGGAFFPTDEGQGKDIKLFQITAGENKVPLTATPNLHVPDYISKFAKRA